MNRSLDSVKKNIAGMRAEAEGLALGLAIREAATFVKRNLDLAGSLGETAQQLGVTTRELQVYRAIGGQAGVTTEEMDTGLQKLTSTIGKASVGAKAQNNAFAALGVSVRDSSGHVKATGVVLEEMADKIAKIPDPAQRAAIEVALFGRAGQKLDTILTGGKKGIQDYARQAEDMGMILSDDLVRAADDASDKIEQLNAQLTANIAGAVAQNANSILGLANALTKLTTGALNFISTYPRLSAALAGAALGSRFGPIGAGVGAAGGMVVGQSMAGSAADGNMDLAFRQRQLNGARAALERRMRPAPVTLGGMFTVRSDASSTSMKDAIEQVRKQTALTRQAIAQRKAGSLPALPAVDLPDFMAGGGGGGKGRSPKAKKDPLEDAAERFGIEMSRIGEDILRIKRDNLTDIDAIAQIDKELLAKQVATEALAIDKDVKDKRITEAQGEQLKTAHAIAAALKGEQINREALADHVREALEARIAANDNERDVLQAQESLAVTTAERRTIQLSLLDLDKQAERLKLQETIDLARLGKATQAQADAAQKRLENIDQVYSLRGESIRQQTRSPLDQYIADNDPKLIGQKVEGYMVAQLDYIQSSLSDAITSRLGIKDPFLAGIIDLFIQTNFIQPLARAMQGAGGGGGGLFGSLLGGIGSIFGGGSSPGGSAAFNAAFAGFADGTNNAPPGVAWVGERGPELVRFRGGEQVIPNHILRGGNDNGGVSIGSINVNGAGMSDRQARETGAQIYRGIRQEQARNVRMGA